MRKLVYAAAELGAFLLVCWTAGGAARAFGYGALAQVAVGLAVGAVFALLSAAAMLKWREVNDRIARLVENELAKREQPVEALLTAVREDCPTPEEVARVRARWEAVQPVPDGYETLMADGKPVARVAKHRLLDPEETQELFTHNYRALAAHQEQGTYSDPCQLSFRLTGHEGGE